MRSPKKQSDEREDRLREKGREACERFLFAADRGDVPKEGTFEANSTESLKGHTFQRLRALIEFEYWIVNRPQGVT
ncbi:MAG: hypothetical protein ABSB35_23310 [Bryobacteraceae bacterium]|jgi:hypothetical protein